MLASGLAAGNVRRGIHWACEKYPGGIFFAPMDWTTFFEHAKPGDKKRFAERLGICPMHLHNIIAGRKQASPKLAQKILQESDNRISLQVLRPKDWHEIWPAAANAPETVPARKAA